MFGLRALGVGFGVAGAEHGFVSFACFVVQPSQRINPSILTLEIERISLQQFCRLLSLKAYWQLVCKRCVSGFGTGFTQKLHKWFAEVSGLGLELGGLVVKHKRNLQDQPPNT